MPETKNESPARTLLVAFLVCATCSVMVSTTAVLLEPRQRQNREQARQEKILQIIADQPGLADLLTGMEGVGLETRVVELATGEYAEHLDPSTFDVARASGDPLLGLELPPDRDLAGLRRISKFAVVYLVEAEGRIELVILPVHGAGYASTLYGYLALAADTNTVAGLVFYDHAESPGLGDEIENPDWLASWRGKRVRDDSGALRIGVARHEVDPDSPDAPYQVDALSGATRTSDGVTALLRFWLGEDGFGPFLARVRRER